MKIPWKYIVLAIVAILILGVFASYEPASVIQTDTFERNIVVKQADFPYEDRYLTSLSANAITKDSETGVDNEIFPDSILQTQAVAITHFREDSPHLTGTGWAIQNLKAVYQIWKDSSTLDTITKAYPGEITEFKDTLIPGASFYLENLKLTAGDTISLQIWFEFDIRFDGKLYDSTEHTFDGRYVTQSITLDEKAPVEPPEDEEPPTADGTFYGIVKDENGVGISGALVKAGIYSDITDSSGMYEIINVPEGSYVIIASAEGYQDATASVIFGGGDYLKNFILSEEEAGFGDSIITEDFDWMPILIASAIGILIILFLALPYVPGALPIKIFIGIIILIILIIVGFLFSAGIWGSESAAVIYQYLEEIK